MTEKEFHKLRRRDLLQLLVAQGKENLQLQGEFDETSAQLQQMQETNERLKARLNEKDALIDKLKGRLDQKDARIKKLREDMEAWKTSRRIQLVEAGSIAEAALRLSGIFETAQKAADQYLYNLRIQCGLEKEELPLELDDGEDDEKWETSPAGEDEPGKAEGPDEADASGEDGGAARTGEPCGGAQSGEDSGTGE